jgi:hypothetical protein
MIGSAGTAIATTTDAVQAVFAKFDYIVNGEEKHYGINTLVIGGSSYLPVREVASIVGYGVLYNEESRTIMLNGVTKPAKGYEDIRTIAERQSLIISFVEDEFSGFDRAGYKIPIPFNEISGTADSPSVIKTEYGDLRMFRDENRNIFINHNDWSLLTNKITDLMNGSTEPSIKKNIGPK